MEGRAEGFGQLVVACGDPAELFELMEKPFDPIALPVERLVVRNFLTPRAQRWNDRFDPIERQTFANPVCIVAFIQRRRLKDIVLRQAFVERFKLATVVGLACG